MSKIESLKDLILVLLYAPGPDGSLASPISGKTRLMKMIFLFKEEVQRKFDRPKTLTKDVLPEFSAYDYGPFSSRVYSDIEFLQHIKFVEVEQVGSLREEEDEYAEYIEDEVFDREAEPYHATEYSLSKLGENFTREELYDGLSDTQKSVLAEFKTRCTSIPLRSLLYYVYTKYPNMTRESKIRDEIMKRHEL